MEVIKTPLLESDSPVSRAFQSLGKSPYDLWITLCIKFTSFAAFSVIAVCSSLYLTKIQNFSEKETGLIFASFGLAISIYSVCLSNLAKLIGLRNTLILGNSIGCLGYALLLIFTDKYPQYLILLTFIMLAIAINLTNTKLGVKYYTYPDSRSIAYTLYYLVFFIAAGFASGIVDIIASLVPEPHEQYQLIFSFGLSLYTLTLVLSLFLREMDLENTEEVDFTIVMPFSDVIKLKIFWKFTALISLILLIKSVYFHLSGTLPVYMDRRIENGNHFGLMMVIHQIMLLIGTPICSYLVFYLDKYTILVLGTFCTAISPAVLYYETTYVGVVLFTVLIAVGESIYAPRLVDYTVEIAPPGAEAVFLGVAAVTNSLPLIITGLTSGFLMDRFCKNGEGNGQCHNMWIWIAGYAVSAVVIMVVCRKHLEVKPYEKGTE
jgi:predicted MFS family arabinose efflux permease